MNSNKNFADVAIIGFGPRGLSALESLYTNAIAKGKAIKTLIFEQSGQLGNSWIYNTDQTSGNWLNIAERAVDIWAREEVVLNDLCIPPFPTFQNWLGLGDNLEDNLPDRFPVRSKMGEYLQERALSIVQVLELHGLIISVSKQVISLSSKENLFTLKTKDNEEYFAKETVLTIGHQPTNPDVQLKRWIKHTNTNKAVKLYTEPYPVEPIIENNSINSTHNLGIRGFGLAMIDLVRSICIERGGKFKILDNRTRKMQYLPSGREPKTIVPFSLDGMPMAPKPLNKQIDSFYVPSDKELLDYKTSVKSYLVAVEKPDSLDFLIESIIPIVVSKYLNPQLKPRPNYLKELQLATILKEWLKDKSFEHPLIVSKDLKAYNIMELFTGMATGKTPVSLDFCFGHVWRHCQPTMYKLLSFAPLSDELISEIIELDERLKRYSYGPPVDSLQQLLSLVEANIITLEFVKDPNIETMAQGWELSKGIKSIVVSTMVNSVLDPPKLIQVSSPLIEDLLNNSNIEPLHDELAIRTSEDGLVEFSNKERKIRLAVLGRLAKGTLVGVDAIAECFGIRSELWAKGVIHRLASVDKKEQ